MVTGDHPGTARAVAQEVGLLEPGDRVMIGAEILAEGVPRDLEAVSVFARADPEQKLELVHAFQERGHIVAVTGDGVNDAPALSRADIGVAMGRSASDVAREAAHIVVTDDKLATIVAAVAEGRGIYDNIKRVRGLPRRREPVRDHSRRGEPVTLPGAGGFRSCHSSSCGSILPRSRQMEALERGIDRLQLVARGHRRTGNRAPGPRGECARGPRHTSEPLLCPSANGSWLLLLGPCPSSSWRSSAGSRLAASIAAMGPLIRLPFDPDRSASRPIALELAGVPSVSFAPERRGFR